VLDRLDKVHCGRLDDLEGGDRLGLGALGTRIARTHRVLAIVDRLDELDGRLLECLGTRIARTHRVLAGTRIARTHRVLAVLDRADQLDGRLLGDLDSGGRLSVGRLSVDRLVRGQRFLLERLGLDCRLVVDRRLILVLEWAHLGHRGCL
jgi:hypothetical protein